MNVATPNSIDPIERAMSALPNGYYWVRQHNSATGAWELAKLEGLSFSMAGSAVEFHPSDIEEIGAKVEPYAPNPNPPLSRGDYWVRLTRLSGWTIASWVSGRWFFVDGSNGEDVAVVGPRLEKPRADWSGQ